MDTRINKFVAQATGLSRRHADKLIEEGMVSINGVLAEPGLLVGPSDNVILQGKLLNLETITQTIMLNKPVGYVCSRAGQGSKTIYDLLPKEYGKLKPVGRLDKYSSGLILLTNDGQLANQLTHPKFNKQKVYLVQLDKPLSQNDLQQMNNGIKLDDGISHLALKQLSDAKSWQVTMSEGRNRQIRRTFSACGYKIAALHRTKFGPYSLDNLASKQFKQIKSAKS
jgi:pseudouridine synthase